VTVEARSFPSRALIEAGDVRSVGEKGDDGARPRVVWARTRVFGGIVERRGFQIPAFSVSGLLLFAQLFS